MIVHFRSLSREEFAETGEEAGFLTIGSSPGISPSPFSICNEWRALNSFQAVEAGFPITVAGPRGNYTHFPFTPIWAPLFAFQRSKKKDIYHQTLNLSKYSACKANPWNIAGHSSSLFR
jgi:hypothetical protein